MTTFLTWGTFAVYACISSPLMFSPMTRKVFQPNDGLSSSTSLSQEAICTDPWVKPTMERDVWFGRHAHRTSVRILLGGLQRHPKEVFDAVSCAVY